jgi:hypothetical protein
MEPLSCAGLFSVAPYHWQVSWNKKQYKYKKFIQEFPLMTDEQKLIPQSKGRARMVKVPKINDLVSICCGGKIILRGVVRTQFQVGNLHKTDQFNSGESRTHEAGEYLFIYITEVVNKDIKKRGCQRTWIQYKRNEGEGQ